MECMRNGVTPEAYDVFICAESSRDETLARDSLGHYIKYNLRDLAHENVVAVVIAQQLFSHHQLSRLRKFVTAAGLSDRSCTVSCVGWLWQLNRCSTECGATPHSGQTSDMSLVMRALYCSKANSDQNATGREWYGLTEAI